MKIQIANASHCRFAKAISQQIADSAKQRKTGIALRSIAYIKAKMCSFHAIVAIDTALDQPAGFCYIEAWQDKDFVSTSGLIVFENYRGFGIASKIKAKALTLARKYYPNAKVFGLTTSQQVMDINNKLGYQPVAYEKLTKDLTFWQGCQSCVNFEILKRKNYQNCLCTGMLYNLNQFKSKEQKMKIILAFSGGLDTSFCVKYLIDEGFDVYTITVNTGGFDQTQLLEIEKKAYQLGATVHHNIEATKRFYTHCVKYLLFGNVLKNNCYPLSVSAERAFQAYLIAEYANKKGIDHIAHGCTSAGNDQVRFDMMFDILCPNAKIITPIKDQKITRAQAQNYLKTHGIDCSDKTKDYSINQGLWGTSVGGVQTLTSSQGLPEEAWPVSMSKDKDALQEIKISFVKGEPIALNDEAMNPVGVIQKLQSIAQSFGIGRDIHVGDTIINAKGRVGFEAAAPMILIKAHHVLEKHVLTKTQLKIKEMLANTYGELIHEGQFLEPGLRDIEALLSASQSHVSGDVFVSLRPWHFYVTGCQSKYDLMAMQSIQYGEHNETLTLDDIKGFTKVAALQLKTYQKTDNLMGLMIKDRIATI
ncbi:argininosuccinate synthase [Facilibium subflavum]|uniref:argininosuccinate synthase n=1 Tax=Facilibium subflavum TaxID=2219058 RepID=UPI000E65155C|nr:argininosuccinate synthase [Facilibium subflavum]